MSPSNLPRLCALRGATTVEADEASAIDEAVRELITALAGANALEEEQVVSAIFSATPDLRSFYPAAAARAAGWSDVAMLCLAEMPVEGALARCIRILLHVSLPPGQTPQHVYLRGARSLRPDWVSP